MKKFDLTLCFLAAALIWAGTSLAEEPTPLDAHLPVGKANLIASPVPAPDGMKPDQVPLMHYRLHLPADYHETGDQKYPAMFIASPMGNAQMGEMRDALMRDRWIVATLVESRNGSSDWLPNFMAAYDDLIQRVRVQKNMLFCTGLSGAAKVCSVYPGIRPGFRGMILQAAGPWGGRVFHEPGNENLLVFGTFGTLDGNFHHARRIRISLPEGVRRLVEIWDGGHAWAPRDVFEPALAWMERAALSDQPYDRMLNDAYRWYAENRLADYARATSDIGRHAALVDIQSLPPGWRDTADPDLIDRIDMALSTTTEPNEPELAAFDAYKKLLRDDERDHGRNPADIAAAYQAIAAEFANTVFGAKAAARGQAVMWETGQYP